MSNVVTMSREDYYANPAIGSSALNTFIRDPGLFWCQYVKSPADAIVVSDEMILGSMTDVLLTEGYESFLEQFYVVPEKTRRGSDKWRTYEANSGGRTVVKGSLVAQAEACVSALEANSEAVRFLQTSAGIRQFSHVWECPKTGLMLRCRLDSLIPPPYRIAGDLKTWSRSGEGPRRIASLAADRGVDNQAELYMRGILDAQGWVPRAWVLVVVDPATRRVHSVDMPSVWFERTGPRVDRALEHLALLLEHFRNEPRAWKTAAELGTVPIMPPAYLMYEEAAEVPTLDQIHAALENLPEPNRPK